MKKLFLVVLFASGLLFSGCALSVPLDPALLMLLKDDGPPPKLEVMPKSDEPTPAKPTPAEVARNDAAAMS